MLRAALPAGALALLTACHPGAPAAPSGLAGSSWSVDLKGRDGISYGGTLEVIRSLGAGAYRGYLKIGFEDPDGAYEAVQEDALITEYDDHITVVSSKPVVLTENGEYVPDNFYLTRQGSNVLHGYEKDILSIGGTVTLTKNGKR